jgi:hypothetical protein
MFFTFFKVLTSRLLKHLWLTDSEILNSKVFKITHTASNMPRYLCNVTILVSEEGLQLFSIYHTRKKMVRANAM